ncbi:LysR family transcriptional regulator [Lactiplantibacillus herbarum]|uniref:LysR family transcriptional regulator n=1 Tax=Lactiplantibacillus herbarum TaxID=1670446 RepID=UPI00064EBDA9|nr:LysR family transcriptional regulator [Lactiplantibacillus herbarum]
MKLSTLNYFVTVANEMSFTNAAAKLYISQPTLSRHIQELESELGVSLFVRHSHTLALTHEGERCLIAATDILERADHLGRMFQEQPSAKRTTIFKIGYLPNFNLGKMYEKLDQFKVSHPNVQFVMNQDTPMNLAEGVATGTYDLVFCLASYFQDKATITPKFFMENHLQVALPVQHPLNKKAKLQFSDLKQETVILLERQQSPVIVDFVINQGLKNGFNLKANYYVKSLDEGLSAVAVGKGLAFLYSGMNGGNLEQQYHIKVADIENQDLDQNIVVAVSRNNESLLNELYEVM